MKSKVMTFVDDEGNPLFARYLARECYKPNRNYDDTDTDKETCDCVAAGDECWDKCDESVPDEVYPGYSVSEDLENGLPTYPKPEKGGRSYATHPIRFEVQEQNGSGDPATEQQPAVKRTVLAHVLDVDGYQKPVYIGYEIASTTQTPINATVIDASAGFCILVSFTPAGATDPITTTVLLVNQ